MPSGKYPKTTWSEADWSSETTRTPSTGLGNGKPGAKVLEFGGGTGVQSFFAAQKAQKVYCVERNPELVDAARSLLAKNLNGDKIEVIQADAMHYLPPEPVDVVICEMLHTGLLREKQMPIISSFKKRYWKNLAAHYLCLYQKPVFRQFSR